MPLTDLGDAEQQARVRHPAEPLITLVPGPEVLLVLPANRALEINSPGAAIRIEVQRAERDFELDGPAVLTHLDPGVPDPVPGPVVAAAGAHERVGHETRRVHLEKVAGLLV